MENKVLLGEPLNDRVLHVVLRFVRTGEYPAGFSDYQKRRFREKFGAMTEGDGDKLLLDGKQVVSTAQAETIIKTAWQDPATGFISAAKLWDKLQDKYIGISRRHVAEVVARFEANQLIGTRRHQITISPLKVSKPRRYFQIDLVDKQSLAPSNHNYAYLLSIVDVFSKYAAVLPIREKSSGAIVSALTKWMADSGAQPKVIHSDNGTEFKNAEMQEFLGNRGIKPVYGQVYRFQSQGAVERFNATIQMRIHRYLLQNDTRQYVAVLPALVANYNETVNEATGKRPIDLWNENASKTDVRQARKKLAAQARAITSKQTHALPSLAVGDYVRVMELSTMKQRGLKIFDRKFRPEFYVIVGKIQAGVDYTYKVSANLAKPSDGPFERVSRFQIAKVPPPDMLIKAAKPVAAARPAVAAAVVAPVPQRPNLRTNRRNEKYVSGIAILKGKSRTKKSETISHQS